MNASILILTGPPGAGKTTAARLLADHSPRAVHLESDLFFRSIASGYIKPWKPESHAQNQVVMRSVAAAARSYAEGGYFTIVDGIVLPRWFLEPLRESFREAGLAAAYAVLRAPLETCLARRAGREGDELADPAAIEGIWRQFSELGELEGHAVDAGSRGAAEVAELIAGRLREGSLALR